MKRSAIRDGIVVAYDDTSVNLRLRHELDEIAFGRLFSGVDLVNVRRILDDKAVYNVRLANGCDDIFALCDELMRQDEVIWAEPDHLLTFGSQEVVGPRFPDDPLLARQWHINIVGVPITWSLTNGTGTDSVAVAVLDTGVLLNSQGLPSHPDLSEPRIVLRTNTGGGQGVGDTHGHGTHVAGIVGASSNNGIGVAGINWSSRILIYKVQAPDDSAPASAIAAACTDALGYFSTNTRNGVVNLSVGQASVSQTLYDMCDSVQTFNAQHGGTSQAIICAAAGNEGTAPAWYPAGYSVDFPTAVVGVGATDQDDELASLSNRGSGTTLVAPGEDICSTTKDGGYGLKSGTSMACPLVSGLLSLIWSLHPRFSSAEAIAMLTSNCFPLASGDLPNPTWGYGRVTALTESQFLASRLQVQTGSAPDPSLTLAFNTYNSMI